MLNLGVASVSLLNINSFLEWNQISIIMAAVPILVVAALAFVPESPYHLVNKGDEKGAENAIKER